MDRVADGAGTPDRSRGAIEDREEAVTRHVDLPPVEPLELPTGHADIPVQEFAPAAVPDRRGTPRPAPHVNEQHGGEPSILLQARARARDEFFDLLHPENPDPPIERL